MPTAPTNPITGTGPEGGTAKKYSEYGIYVFLGDDDGTAITSTTQIVDYLIPIQLTQKLGSKGLDKCTFAYDLAKDDKRVLDLKVPTTFGRQIEVRQLTGTRLDTDSGLYRREWDTLFWGELSTQTISVDEEERSVLEASIRPYHFGTLITGEKQWNTIASTSTVKDGYITFNPVIDGQVINNRSDSNTVVPDVTDPDEFWYLWADPESIRTQLAKDANSEDNTAWYLYDVIKTICGYCNPDEDFIINPTSYDLNHSFDSTIDPQIKNIKLKPGKYLSEYLDEILHPHGFDWCIILYYDNDDDCLTEKYFEFYKKGEGPVHNLKFQRPGEILDSTKSNVNHFRVDYDVNSLANHIIVQGSHKEKEGSFILYPCWKEQFDAEPLVELNKDDKDSRYHTYTAVSGIKNAWRLWTLNEGGDYSNLRTVSDPRTIPTTATSLATFFGEPAIPQRRKPSKPLYLDDDGKRLDFQVDFTLDFDTAPADGTTASWYKLKNSGQVIGYQVLRDQIGIIFTDDTPPWFLYDALIAKCGVMLTCSIRSDVRITGTATRQGSSPQLRSIKQFIDKSDSFHLREVQLSTATPYPSLNHLDNPSGETDAIDNTTGTDTITEYAEKIRDDFDSAEIRTTMKMKGIHLTPERFSLVKKIEGRNISLNRNTDGISVTKKYLQVTGRIISFQQPIMTTLTVEKPRER